MFGNFLRLAVMLTAALYGAVAHGAGSVKFENALAACVDIRPGLPTSENGQFTLQVTLDVKRIIAECGCKSAVSSYASFAQRDGYRSFLQSGVLSLGQSGMRTLTLASDSELVGGGDIVLVLGCALPD